MLGFFLNYRVTCNSKQFFFIFDIILIFLKVNDLRNNNNNNYGIILICNRIEYRLFFREKQTFKFLYEFYPFFSIFMI